MPFFFFFWLIFQGAFIISMDLANYFLLGENTILILTFWSRGQFGPYIFVTVNLVPIIFNLKSIWSLPLTH